MFSYSTEEVSNRAAASATFNWGQPVEALEKWGQKVTDVPEWSQQKGEFTNHIYSKRLSIHCTAI